MFESESVEISAHVDGGPSRGSSVRRVRTSIGLNWNSETLMEDFHLKVSSSLKKPWWPWPVLQWWAMAVHNWKWNFHWSLRETIISPQIYIWFQYYFLNPQYSTIWLLMFPVLKVIIFNFNIKISKLELIFFKLISDMYLMARVPGKPPLHNWGKTWIMMKFANLKIISLPRSQCRNHCKMNPH